MSGNVDSRELDKEPFVIENRVFVLGNPVISAYTLEQLVHALDQLGVGQPVVIINPEANTIPNFDSMVGQLIQNNRRVQPMNVTTTDKYAFKDATPEQLQQLARDTAEKNPAVDAVGLYQLYLGLKTRAESLFKHDQLCAERDALWQAHCANPDSQDGSERYGLLQSVLIPQALAEYQTVCQQLAAQDATYQASQQEFVKQNSVPVIPQKPAEEPAVVKQTPVAATSSVPQVNNYTQEPAAVKAAVPVESGLTDIGPRTADTPVPKVWGPWISPLNLKMPLKDAFSLAASPGYAGLVAQQRDVEFENAVYHAVEPGYLLALGVPLYPDGIPVVYTSLGKFRRIGKGTTPGSNVRYWYPEPQE